MDPQDISDHIGEIVRRMGWKKDWANGGVYIHLEVSEFIEALRGKGESSAVSEAGDVIVSFFAVLDHYGIKVESVLRAAQQNLKNLERQIPGHFVIVSPHNNEGNNRYFIGQYYNLQEAFKEVKTSSVDAVATILLNLGYAETQKAVWEDKFATFYPVKTSIQCDKYITQYQGFANHITELKHEIKENGLLE